ncbi:stage II sporulation protein M [Crocinitomix algicola]|uniref:stage II sporulation protein M n=1 Tax=Crocinitomix algicola TaxID=1740263 RepID=UPI0008722389|nr:stage II sporulation protein M [Crocinitomix algicola]
MKETDFIKQNKKKWARFEKLSNNSNNDPDEVSELFTEITEDLSYAKTFYPRRSVRVYLNQLSQGVFTSLYKQRKQPIGNFMKFWKEVVPLEMYRARRNLVATFCFFVLAILVGVISQHYDVDFVRVIFGDYYVESTEERIANGNPMGVYGESSQGAMFFAITINNIRVAFLAFTGGILFTLGTYWVMLQNGIMLGAFQWWFKAKGLLFTTFLTIWIHGAFEISAIVIAGAAGLTVGNGLIFPKSYSRMQSLIFSAKRGMIIMLSLVPVFIMAGALESYVTRHYQVIPTVLKLLIIFGSFAIILFYYVYYPVQVAKKFPEKIKVQEIPRFIPKKEIVWYKIRKPGEIFTDTFTLFISHSAKLSKLFFNLVFPLFAGMLILVFALEWFRFDYNLDWHQTFGSLFGTGNDFNFYKLLGWPVPLTFLMAAGFFVLSENKTGKFMQLYIKFALKHFVWLYLYMLMVYSIFLFSPGVLLFLLILIAPFLTVIPSIIVLENVNFFTAISRSFDLGKGGYGDILLSNISLIAITIIFFFVLHNPFELGILTIINDFVKDTLITVLDEYRVVIAVVNSVAYIFFLFLIVTLASFSFSLSYYSVQERKTAKGMFDRLTSFGKRSRHFETDLDFE